jgi:hypothetical protein
MTIPLWLVILAILAIIIWIIISAAQTNKQNELSCVTCGKYHAGKSSLAQCDICKRMVCFDNLETIESKSTASNTLVEVSPSEMVPTHPCGAFFFDDNSLHIYCRKDTPRFKSAYSFTFKK